MKCVNDITIIGYVGKAPAFRNLPDGNLISKFSVAATRKWKNKNTGEWEEEAEWFNVEAWKYLAERVERDIKKGSPVYVRGSMKTERWKDKKTGDDRQQKIIKAADLFLLGERRRPDSAPKKQEEDSAF